MKKSILKVLGVFVMTSSLFFASCSSDDDKGGSNPDTSLIDPENMQGEFTGKNIVLDANVVYKLKGPLVMLNGSKLTIPAGTKIEATGGTSSYIAIGQNAQIFVNGTATNPVVITNPTQTPGSWGGLVICGNAPINKAATASAEVSGLTYGGTVTGDNSGSIKYLRIEYSGAIFSNEKEFNGLSLFGVGSGTVIDYVQVYHGTDDGFEFFGGTVNTSNLVSVGNEDDQFDWTEGWIGNNTNWYAKEGFGKGNRGIEADNLGGNNSMSPYSDPTITNVTLVGIPQSGEPQGLKLREGTKGTLNNVVLANWATGIDIQHDVTIAWAQNGDLKINGVKFENVGTESKGSNSAGTSVDVTGAYTVNSNATGAGNGINTPTWAQGWTNMTGL